MLKLILKYVNNVGISYLIKNISHLVVYRRTLPALLDYKIIRDKVETHSSIEDGY